MLWSCNKHRLHADAESHLRLARQIRDGERPPATWELLMQLEQKRPAHDRVALAEAGLAEGLLSPGIHLQHAAALHQLGRTEEARATLLAGLDLTDDAPWDRAKLLTQLAVLSDPEEMTQLCHQVLAMDDLTSRSIAEMLLRRDETTA